MSLKLVFYIGVAFLFYLVAYFAQIAIIIDIPSSIHFLIRVALASIGAYFLFLAFFKVNDGLKSWYTVYFVAVVVLGILYVMKITPSVIENFYMTVHRLITTPILAVIIVLANKFQNK